MFYPVNIAKFLTTAFYRPPEVAAVLLNASLPPKHVLIQL